MKINKIMTMNTTSQESDADMKYIKTPDEKIYLLDDCEILEYDEIKDENEYNETQKELASLLFVQQGILVSEIKGGEKIS